MTAFDMRVSVSPRALHEMANRIDDHALRIEQSVLRARQTFDQLMVNGVFVGRSAETLLVRYYQNRESMQRLAARVREYARRIRLTASAIETADRMQQSSSLAAPVCYASTFLTGGQELIVRREDGKSYAIFRNADGTEKRISLDEIDESDRGALFEVLGKGLGVGKDSSKTGADLFNLKRQLVSESDRAAAYWRRYPGSIAKAEHLSEVGKSFKRAGYIVDAGLVIYHAGRIIVGDNGDYYETNNLGTLSNGMQFTVERYVNRDANEDLFKTLGGIGGGLLAGAAATGLVGFFAGGPVSILLGGAFVIVSSLVGSMISEEGGKWIHNTYLDYDTTPPQQAPTDLRFTSQGVDGRAARQSIQGSGNIDLVRLLESDGEVVFQRDANGHLTAMGGVNGAPQQIVNLGR